jgi:hypothetical protein
LQRRPAAVLAAWDATDNRLEHFWWAITAELADHAGMDADELENRQADRAEFLQALARSSGHNVAGHATTGHTVPGHVDHTGHSH